MQESISSPSTSPTRSRQLLIRPCIAELLSTCKRPQSMLLQIAHVARINASPDTTQLDFNDDGQGPPRQVTRRAVKLFLTDGHVSIQALFPNTIPTTTSSPNSNRIRQQLRDVEKGDFVDVHDFDVKRARRTNGEGSVIFLSVKECKLIKSQTWEFFNPASTLQPVLNASLTPGSATVSEQDEGRKVANESKHGQIDGSMEGLGSKTEQSIKPILEHDNGPTRKRKHNYPEDDGDEEDGFETMAVDTDTLQQRRRALRDIERHSQSQSGSQPNAQVESRREPDGASTHIDVSYPSNRKPATAEAKPIKSDLQLPTNTTVPTEAPPRIPPVAVPTAGRLVTNPTTAAGTRPVTTKKSVRFSESLVTNVTSAPVPPQNTTTITNATTTRTPFLLPNPPFHTLHSLRYPLHSSDLPHKNYSVSTLAFVVWSGSLLTSKPQSNSNSSRSAGTNGGLAAAMPSKRNLKIEDPSLASSPRASRADVRPGRDDTERNLRGRSTNTTTASTVTAATAAAVTSSSASQGQKTFIPSTSFSRAVTLSVYVPTDVETIRPRSGTLVLLRGVVMQRVGNGDVILNAYPRSQHQLFEGDVADADQGLEDTTIAGGGGGGEKQSRRRTGWYIDDIDTIRRIVREQGWCPDPNFKSSSRLDVGANTTERVSGVDTATATATDTNTDTNTDTSAETEAETEAETVNVDVDVDVDAYLRWWEKRKMQR